MKEIRSAKKGEMVRQKEIWKLCFGDKDSYIDFYYAHRYKEDETLLLLQDGEISAMLTLMPVKVIAPDNRSFDAVMLYAIATHPQYQNKGFATQLLDFSNRYLRSKNITLSILVPAEKQLFDFYRKQGYQDGFYLREARLTREMIERLPLRKSCKGTIFSIIPQEYNKRRNKQLNGKLYTAYTDKDIAYQKKLSEQSGAEIYALDFEKIQGCLAVERMTPDKLLIKEILLPGELINGALKQIAQILDAKEYIVRTPAYLGEDLGGVIRPFGMIRILKKNNVEIAAKQSGYLGLAFD